MDEGLAALFGEYVKKEYNRDNNYYADEEDSVKGYCLEISFPATY